MNADEAKKVLEQMEQYEYSCMEVHASGTWENIQALRYALTLFDEVDRLKAEIKILQDDEKDCENCPELDRMGREIEKWKKGADITFVEGSDRECGHFVKAILSYCPVCQEIARLKGRVGELEKQYQCVIADPRKYQEERNWVTESIKNDRLKAKLKAVREIDFQDICILHSIHPYDLVLAIKSKIDETIGEPSDN